METKWVVRLARIQLFTRYSSSSKEKSSWGNRRAENFQAFLFFNWQIKRTFTTRRRKIMNLIRNIEQAERRLTEAVEFETWCSLARHFLPEMSRNLKWRLGRNSCILKSWKSAPLWKSIAAQASRWSARPDSCRRPRRAGSCAHASPHCPPYWRR